MGLLVPMSMASLRVLVEPVAVGVMGMLRASLGMVVIDRALVTSRETVEELEEEDGAAKTEVAYGATKAEPKNEKLTTKTTREREREREKEDSFHGANTAMRQDMILLMFMT